MDRLPLSYLAHLNRGQRLQQSNAEEKFKDVSNYSDEQSSGGCETGEQGSHRKRGRPPGSRNRPKSPVVITSDGGYLVRAHVMEVAAGHDVVESVAEFARRRQVGLGVISGSGTIAAVTVRGPDGAMLPLRGRFEVASLSGSVLAPPSPPAASWLTVYLVGAQGQVVGGSVVGAMVAAVPMMIMATSFRKAAYEKLPLIPEEPPDQNVQLLGPLPELPPLPQQLVAAGNSRPPFHGHPPPLPGPVNNNLPPAMAGDDFGSWNQN